MILIGVGGAASIDSDGSIGTKFILALLDVSLVVIDEMQLIHYPK